MWLIGPLIAAALLSGCREAADVPAGPDIDEAVRGLLARYNISQKAIRSKKIASAGGTHVRVERRVHVSDTFDMLGFNRDLKNAVDPLGAAVVATERSDDGSVAVHVKKDGAIIRSIVFIVDKSRERKPGGSSIP